MKVINFKYSLLVCICNLLFACTSTPRHFDDVIEQQEEVVTPDEDVMVLKIEHGYPVGTYPNKRCVGLQPRWGCWILVPTTVHHIEEEPYLVSGYFGYVDYVDDEMLQITIPPYDYGNNNENYLFVHFVEEGVLSIEEDIVLDDNEALSILGIPSPIQVRAGDYVADMNEDGNFVMPLNYEIL